MENEITLTAYNVRSKQKNVPILNAVIKKTKKGAYMAQGVAEDGAKLVTLMSKEKAEQVIAAGLAVFASEEPGENSGTIDAPMSDAPTPTVEG